MQANGVNITSYRVLCYDRRAGGQAGWGAVYRIDTTVMSDREPRPVITTLGSEISLPQAIARDRKEAYLPRDTLILLFNLE